MMFLIPTASLLLLPRPVCHSLCLFLLLCFFLACSFLSVLTSLSPCLAVPAMITPMTVLHQQHNGDLQAMKDKFDVASKGIVFKIKVCCIRTQCCCKLQSAP